MKTRTKITFFAFFLALASEWYGGADFIERSVSNALLILSALVAALFANSYPLSFKDEKEIK